MTAYRFLGVLFTIAVFAVPALGDDKAADANQSDGIKSNAQESASDLPPALASVRAQIEQAWSKHQSLIIQAHSRVHTPGALRTMELTGTIWVQREPGDDLLRSDTVVKTTLGEGERADSMFVSKLEVFDGTDAYQLRNQGNESRLVKLDPVRLQRVAGAELFDQLVEFSEVTVLNEKTEGDDTFIVLAATPRESKPPLHVIHVYIDKANGVMRRLVMLDTDGSEMQTLNLFDAEYDEEIDPKLFVFEPPAEIKLEDQTTTSSPASDASSMDDASDASDILKATPEVDTDQK